MFEQLIRVTVNYSLIIFLQVFILGVNFNEGKLVQVSNDVATSLGLQCVGQRY